MKIQKLEFQTPAGCPPTVSPLWDTSTYMQKSVGGLVIYGFLGPPGRALSLWRPSNCSFFASLCSPDSRSLSTLIYDAKMRPRSTQNQSKIDSDRHWIFINTKPGSLQPLPREKLIFAFPRGPKIHQNSFPVLIKMLSQSYSRRRSKNSPKNLPMTPRNLPRMGPNRLEK